jgi:hypothetical protein
MRRFGLAVALLTAGCTSWSRPEATNLATAPLQTPVRGLTASGERIEGRLVAMRGDTVVLRQGERTVAVAGGTAWQARSTDVGRTLLLVATLPVVLTVGFMLDRDGVSN